jgi:predicted 2-oxoglutarate/Fe(II)-dependent dioxygenase YbiX
VLTLVEALPRPAPQVMSGTAPVLLIPRVLSPEDCRRLIAVWETRNEESGTITMGKGGAAESASRPDVKRRRDHHVTDPALFAELSERVLARIAPEIARAFCSEVAAVEEFKIVRYDAEVGGFFRPHRDDPIPERAHRRFAMTLNLNDDYEGGHLRFAEFGPHLYRPAAGEAVIFSCALLHEALDVTRGQRFVLLSFLMDREGERHRAERAAWFKRNIAELERALAAQKAGRR